MMNDSLVNIIAPCLCHKLCVSSCYRECVSALFQLRRRAHAVASPAAGLGVDNWVKIPPINAGVCHKSTQSKQCPGWWPGPGEDQSLLTNQRPQSELPDQSGAGQRGGVLSWYTHFLVTPVSCSKMSVTFVINVMTEDVSLRRQHQTSHWTVRDRREIRSRNIPFDNKTLHWHWSLSVPGSSVMLTLIFCIVCIYLIAESVRLFVVMFETLRLTVLTSSRCKWIVGFDRGQYYKP